MIVWMAKEPTGNLEKKHWCHFVFSLLCEIILKCILSDNMYEADKDNLLLYESAPVLLYKIPSKQVAGEAVTHSADDQRQLLCLDDIPVET